MDQWAANPAFEHVAFFCICVEGTPTLRKQVAMNFVRDLKIQNTFLGYFQQDNEMPKFGQLGCQGFILALPDGRVALPRSPPWVQYRASAFQWIEKLLESWKAGSDEEGEEGEANCIACQGGDACCKQAPCESSCGGACPCASESCCDGTAQACSQQEACTGGTCSMQVAFNDVESVKVASMDSEHQEIVALLRALEDKRDLHSLKAALKCMTEHFEHEEQLLTVHQFGGLSSTVVMEGHVGDHKAILSMMATEASQCDIMSRQVSAMFLRELAERFEFHTREYDSRYADFLAEKGLA
jgi:hemerythrin